MIHGAILGPGIEYNTAQVTRSDANPPGRRTQRLVSPHVISSRGKPLWPVSPIRSVSKPHYTGSSAFVYIYPVPSEREVLRIVLNAASPSADLTILMHESFKDRDANRARSCCGLWFFLLSSLDTVNPFPLYWRIYYFP